MKVKTSELQGSALDWAVAKAERRTIDYFRGIYKPSTDWAQGGPIIEREKIAMVYRAGEYWLSYTFDGAKFEGTGPTPLIAAMRCYLASKLGDEIEVPEELN